MDELTIILQRGGRDRMPPEQAWFAFVGHPELGVTTATDATAWRRRAQREAVAQGGADV